MHSSLGLVKTHDSLCIRVSLGHPGPFYKLVWMRFLSAPGGLEFLILTHSHTYLYVFLVSSLPRLQNSQKEQYRPRQALAAGSGIPSFSLHSLDSLKLKEPACDLVLPLK